MLSKILFCCVLLAVGAASARSVEKSAGPGNSSPSVLVIGGSMMNGSQFAESTLPTMREHFAGCRRIALVLHASHPSDRDAMERRLAAAFQHLNGSTAASLHHGTDTNAAERLRNADGIFVGGGETFVLLKELYRSGQLELIRQRVQAGIPYAGSSAGANVAGMRIGTTNDFPVADIPSRDALGIFPAIINPHHPAAEPKAEFDSRAGKIRIYLQFNPAETVLGLGNAAMARLHAGEVTITSGSAWLYRAGESRTLALGGVPELTLTAAELGAH